LEILDIILIAMMLISGLLAMVRGFSREILSISSWVVAALAGYFFYQSLSPTVNSFLTNNVGKLPEILSHIVAGLIIFIIVLIIVSLITYKIADFIVDSRIGALDRTLGFIFGAVRGLLLVVVMYMFVINFIPDSTPKWVANAKSAPMLQSIGESIQNSLPEDPTGFIKEKLGISIGSDEADGQDT